MNFRVQVFLVFFLWLLVTLVVTMLMDFDLKERSKIAAIKVEVWTLAIVIDELFAKTGQYPKGRNPNGSPQNYFEVNTLQGDHLFEEWIDSKYNRNRIVVQEAGHESAFRTASKEELALVSLPKYCLDAWGNPYRYRENASLTTKTPAMQNPESFDLWSCGPDGVDGEGEFITDDIGSWSMSRKGFYPHDTAKSR